MYTGFGLAFASGFADCPRAFAASCSAQSSSRTLQAMCSLCSWSATRRYFGQMGPSVCLVKTVLRSLIESEADVDSSARSEPASPSCPASAASCRRTLSHSYMKGKGILRGPSHLQGFILHSHQLLGLGTMRALDQAPKTAHLSTSKFETPDERRKMLDAKKTTNLSEGQAF